MLNAIGLQNVGVRSFAAEKLPKLAQLDTAVFANVFGYTPNDYVEVLRVLEDADGAGWLRAECFVPEYEARRDAVRIRPRPAGRGRQAGARRREQASPDRQTIAERDGHHRHGAGRRGGGGRCDLVGEYVRGRRR